MKHHLQTIHGLNGKPEYVLLPVGIYQIFKKEIENRLELLDDYVDFNPQDYLSNPIVLMRIEAGLTQTELAKKLDVSQAYVCKIEREGYSVTVKLLDRIKKVIKK